MAVPRLEFVGASVRRSGALVLDGIDLAIPAGAFVALTGASGAGKTTLLRLANRLLAVDAGRVLIDGQDVAAGDAATLRRGIGYAIQGVGLFPHWTIADNIAAVPRLIGTDAAEIAARVRRLLDLVELPQDFAGRYPRQLSGGQASRVGLARALAAAPRLLLLDEPFGALDPETRASLADKLVELHRAEDLTIVMVTHDLADALTRAERIIVLDAGRIAADGTPAELVRSAHPAVQALVASPVDQARRIAALLE
ncbi:MAG: ABC transporter ATP-binding protein [Alphaproteobacteria bacterium]|nr:MAG: ABC transporter ATP-binding protein [Alphaproteobacteria bacterium]